jgi:hypothetical protein
MTTTLTTCATAVALLAGMACFTAPAAAQSAPTPWSHHTKISSSHTNQKQFLSAVALYDAGLRRGRANSSRNAYLRGFRDGTSSEAYSSRQYVVNSASGSSVAPASGYSLYDRDAVYAPAADGDSSYDGRSVAYRDANGYGDGRYDAGYAPHGLMDVVVAPVAAAPAVEAQAAHWSYCTARYQSFDPVSDTFLAFDGNRYYCR